MPAGLEDAQAALVAIREFVERYDADQTPLGCAEDEILHPRLQATRPRFRIPSQRLYIARPRKTLLYFAPLLLSVRVAVFRPGPLRSRARSKPDM